MLAHFFSYTFSDLPFAWLNCSKLLCACICLYVPAFVLIALHISICYLPKKIYIYLHARVSMYEVYTKSCRNVEQKERRRERERETDWARGGALQFKEGFGFSLSGKL